MSQPGENPASRTSVAAVMMVVNLSLRLIGNFAIIPICLRYLSKEEYGLWIILQTLSMYLGLSEIGLAQTVINFIGVAFAKGDRNRVNEVLSTAFGLYWLIVLPVLVVTLVIGWVCPVDHWFLKEANPHVASLFRPAFLLMATFTLLQIPLTIFPATLPGLREMPFRQLYEFVLILLGFAAMVGVLVLGGHLLNLIIVTNLFSLIAMLLVYPLLIRTRVPFVKVTAGFWNPRLLRSLVTNSGFFFIMGLAFMLDRSAGNLILGKYGTLTQVPSMFVLLTLFRVLGWSVVDMISRVLQPYVTMFAAQGREESVHFFAALSAKIGFAVAVMVASTLWLLGEYGLRIWLGRGLFPGYAPVGFLAGVFLIDSLFLSTTNFLVALNRHHSLALVAVWKSMLTLGLGVLGTYLYPASPFTGITAGFFAASILGQALVLPRVTMHGLRLDARFYGVEFIARPALLLLSVAAVILFVRVPSLRLLPIRAALTGGVLCLTAMLTWFFVLGRSERSWIIHQARRRGSGRSSNVLASLAIPAA